MQILTRPFSSVIKLSRLSRSSSYRQFSSSPAFLSSTSAISSRLYFYTLDTHGQLFLTSAPHKNFISSYKDVAFLDLFFRRLRPLTVAEVEAQGDEEKRYRWVSECMGERNLVESEGGVPIVFTAVAPSSSTGELELTVCGGRTKVNFEPDKIGMSEDGYVFHRLPQDRWAKLGQWGLIGGRVVTEGLGGELREGLESGDGFRWRGVEYETEIVMIEGRKDERTL